MTALLLAAAGLAAACPALAGVGATALAVKAVNRLDIPRRSETIELSAQQLRPLGAQSLRRIHVVDAAGKQRLCQAVDSDGDGAADQVVFQSDFERGESQVFTVFAGAPRRYRDEDFRRGVRVTSAPGLAWENGRTAHRIDPEGGAGLEHAAHRYSAGPASGAARAGVWADGRLATPGRLVASRVLAGGPIRLVLEAVYEGSGARGACEREVRRIRMDAGQHFTRFAVCCRTPAAAPVAAAMGIGKREVAWKEARASDGWLAAWGPASGGALGHLGSALVVDPALYQQIAEDEHDVYVLTRPGADGAGTYWLGAVWDRGGQFPSFAAWKAQVNRFARGLRSPVEVTVLPRDG